MRALLLLPLAAVAATCSTEEALLAALGGECVLNSDCDAGLVCVFARCHTPCKSTKDCPAAERCVAGDRPQHVCQLDDGARCVLHSDCAPGQICALDGACRDECATDRDCLPGQLCRAATCAEPSELVNGRLPPGSELVGKPCSYSSDCAGGGGALVLVCRGGSCDVACYESRDCRRFETCTEEGGLEPGNCIPSAQFFCDPKDGAVKCDCFKGGPTAAVDGCTQSCAANGSGYGPCR